MNMIYLVLPLALLLAGAAVAAFMWAARRGQFDDLETPAQRMLHDDLPVEIRRDGKKVADEEKKCD
jgi:cbb3-type cytochrome oxidase maturation protein